jgi:hypothetical protein
MFSINAPLAFTPVGEVPDGYRVDLHYGLSDSGTTPPVYTKSNQGSGWPANQLEGVLEDLRASDGSELCRKWQDLSRWERDEFLLSWPADEKSRSGAAFEELKARAAKRPRAGDAWCGIDGTLLSGTDRVLVGRDSVIRLSGRVTIEANDGPLVQTFYSGTIDLGEDGYRKWLLGQLSGSTRVALGVSFEGSSVPEEWASSELRGVTTNAQRYRYLTRRLFLARGEVKFEKQPYSPITGVQLDVWDASEY